MPFFQIRYCTTLQQRCGLTHTSPRATTASPPLTPGSPSTTIPRGWHLLLLAHTWWGLMDMTGRLTSCHSSNSSSSPSSNRVSYSSCNRSNRSSTTSNSSYCSTSNNRWSLTPVRCVTHILSCSSTSSVLRKIPGIWNFQNQDIFHMALRNIKKVPQIIVKNKVFSYFLFFCLLFSHNFCENLAKTTL